MDAEEYKVEDNHDDGDDGDFQSGEEEIVHWSLEVGDVDGYDNAEEIDGEDGEDC